MVSVTFDDINDSLERINAFTLIRKEPSFKVLAISCKRIKNIIKGNDDPGVKAELFEEDAEFSSDELFAKMQEAHAMGLSQFPEPLQRGRQL